MVYTLTDSRATVVVEGLVKKPGTTIDVLSG